MFFYLIIFILIALDQFTKYLIESGDKEPLNVIPGFLEFRYSQNTGIAFSFLEDHPQLLLVINSIIILVLIFYFLKMQTRSFLQGLAFALIIAGGLGNLLDRYIHGYVIDFINPTFIDFAIFNLADSYLNLGVALFIIKGFFYAKRDH